MLRRPPRSTRTDTLVPYTTLFRSALKRLKVTEIAAEDLRQPPVLPIGLPLDEARRRMDADALDFAVVLDDERRLHGYLARRRSDGAGVVHDRIQLLQAWVRHDDTLKYAFGEMMLHEDGSVARRSGESRVGDKGGR